MKELTNLSKSFDKISSEANALQQRMGAYMKIWVIFLEDIMI